MSTDTLDFLLADPLLEDVRLFVLETGKFNMVSVQTKFRVGFHRAVNFRVSLIAEGIIDAVETDGQNWLAGSLVLKEEPEELENVLEKIVSIVGPGGSKDFEKLVRVMAVERSAAMRMVILAGIKCLANVLGK